ncbi:DUF1667 domain-containing protein [Fonticella tunisiensis]|uniref:CxxC motif-containing protein n=1 Tax=Fonticella tunisiensis TaxID=1096341 RepID=A0A4V3EUU3_9CLOT|nr:DUF1667 domain-containing protein [Fonticella tunisiensis]TDT61277.1 CxxC motif-containing protein [Fonticella tunisiensis]
MDNNVVVCTICPNECEIDVIFKENIISEITGNKCARGKNFAEDEIKHPKRILTTTVLIENGVKIPLPVRSEKPIPKELLGECMKVLKKVVVRAPIKLGDVVVSNILNTGIDIVATKSVNRSGYN